MGSHGSHDKQGFVRLTRPASVQIVTVNALQIGKSVQVAGVPGIALDALLSDDYGTFNSIWKIEHLIEFVRQMPRQIRRHTFSR